MPNPEFEGTVPRMRCETCKHWHPHSDVDGHPGAGACGKRANQDRRYMPQTIITLDLSVCSNWQAKATVLE